MLRNIRLAKQISSRSAFLILTIFVIIHVVVSYLFIYENRVTLRNANRDQIIQKLINTIHLVEATPELNRKHAVAAIQDPNMKISLSSEPKWPLQFSDISLWAISQSLRNHYDSFAISIQMDNGAWLNINATVYSHFLMMQIILITMEFFVFGAILFAAWSINRFTAPLREFKQAADQLGMDIHAKPLSIYGPNIVRETAEAMNTMQQRIQDSVRERTQMLAAISHDLRTPITRMKLRAQFVDDKVLLAKFTHDLDEMESMIAQTLSFARDDHSSKEKVKVDLCSLMESICFDMQDVGHNVSYHSTEHTAAIQGRCIALKRAFSNLIDNGLKYGKEVTITLKKCPQHIAIHIDDNGPGIPEDELEKVLQPFYRGDKSRSKDTGGVGLGLAFVKEAISNHGGKIKLSNRKSGGLRVTVDFLV
jgi:signal transduction histidine kinase